MLLENHYEYLEVMRVFNEKTKLDKLSYEQQFSIFMLIQSL